MKLQPIRRHLPTDFAERHAELGTVSALGKHYHASDRTIKRFFQEAGLTPRRAGSFMPDNFREVATQGLSLRGLAAALGVDKNCARRWLVEAGLPIPQRKRSEPSAPRYSRPALRYVRAPGYTNIAPTQTYSAEDIAADTLRRFGMVCRCTDTGRADHKGKFWRFGNIVLTGDELIARAARKAA